MPNGESRGVGQTGAFLVETDAGLLARWCGTRPTTWEERPERCREALQEVDADAPTDSGET